MMKWSDEVAAGSGDRLEEPGNSRYDLRDRLINFAVDILNLVELLPADLTGKHIAGQLLRSGTSPAPNYSEAQSAESRKDFIHKLKIALKELRESHTWLLIIDRKEMLSADKVHPNLTECNELIAILVKSIQTARANQET